MIHEHFCPSLSLIAPGPMDQCAACRGELSDEALAQRRRDVLRGGAAPGYEITKARRLAHAGVAHVGRHPNAAAEP